MLNEVFIVHLEISTILPKKKEISTKCQMFLSII